MHFVPLDWALTMAERPFSVDPVFWSPSARFALVSFDEQCFGNGRCPFNVNRPYSHCFCLFLCSFY